MKMKSTLIIAILTLMSISAFANERKIMFSSIKCSAGNKNVYVIQENKKITYVNYEVNGEMNDGADVFLEEGFKLTKNALSFSLNVDGQERMIKVEGQTQPGKFQGVYYGTMKFGKQKTASICVLN